MTLSRESWDNLVQVTVGIHKPPSSFFLQRSQLLLVAAAQGPSAAGRRGAGAGPLGRGLPAEDGARHRRRPAQRGEEIHVDRGQRYGHQEAKSTRQACHGEERQKAMKFRKFPPVLDQNENLTTVVGYKKCAVATDFVTPLVQRFGLKGSIHFPFQILGTLNTSLRNFLQILF